MGAQAVLPSDLVPVARIVGAWGVQGWVRAQAFSADSEMLGTLETWWLRDARGQVSARRCVQARRHSDLWIAELEGLPHREAAEAMKGTEVLASRAAFPAPEEDEYYWVDLVGCAVVDVAGAPLGPVEDVMENGAHAILAVRTGEREGKAVVELIPFVDAHVREVDLAGRRIVVDWSTPV